MCDKTLSDKVVQIMKVLSQIPGADRLEVISKTYPNLTAMGTISHYRQQAKSYSLHDFSNATLPTETEQVSVVLHGTVQSDRPTPSELTRDLLYDHQLSGQWVFHASINRYRRFAIELFPDEVAPPAWHT